MLGNYSKMIGAVVGAMAAQSLLKTTGLDVNALGVSAEFQGLVSGLVDIVITGIAAGVTTYFFPANKKRA